MGAQAPLTPHELFANLPEYARRLVIRDIEKVVRPAGTISKAQKAFFTAFQAYHDVTVLKDRQRFLSTATLMAFLWYMSQSPNEESLITVAHEDGAAKKMNRTLRQFVRGLPAPIRPTICEPNTTDCLVLEASPFVRKLLNFPRNAPGRIIFEQRVAGGKGQGRSETYSHAHFTEAGFFPKGSASVDRETNDEGADYAMVGSVTSTIHRTPRRRQVFESTANGPGVFYDVVQAARVAKDQAFLFFPWFYDDFYTAPIPARWELTDDERDLLRLHGHRGATETRDHWLTEPHLAWRRWKMSTSRMKLERFRKEYPSTVDEPFMVSGDSFFPLDSLAKLAPYASTALCPEKEELVYIFPPVPGKLYFQGQDTCGGVGQDEAAIHVISEDGQLVCRWYSDTTSPWDQAEIGAKISHHYNGALVLVEANNHGNTVFKRMSDLNVNLWLDGKGKPFWTQMGIAGNSKLEILGHLHALLKEDFFIPVDPAKPMLACARTISQLMTMREKGRKIEASRGQHDDLAMSFAMACWCARYKFRGAPHKLPEYTSGIEAIRDLVPGSRESSNPWR